MAALASDWLRHFRFLLWNHCTEFNETWQAARYQRPLPSLCFSGRSKNQDCRPGLWLAETFSTSSLKSLNGIQRNLTGSKILTSSTKFMFFGPIEKRRWPPWPLIGWDIFDFSSETAEQNSTKLDRKQDLNILYQVFVFPVDQKNKMAAMASDWLRHFRILLWNRWTEFKENLTGSKISTSLQSLCFLGLSEKQDGHPGLWLAETFSTSFLKPLNGIQRNLTGSKISTSSLKSGRSEKQDCRPGLWLAETFSTSPLKSLNRIQWNLTGSKITTSSTKFVFLQPIGKTIWSPLPLIGWTFSTSLSTKLDRKQDLNVLCQFCVFRVDQCTKMAFLCVLSKRWHIVTQVHDIWPFGPLVLNKCIFHDLLFAIIALFFKIFVLKVACNSALNALILSYAIFTEISCSF